MKHYKPLLKIQIKNLHVVIVIFVFIVNSFRRRSGAGPGRTMRIISWGIVALFLYLKKTID